MSCIECGRCGRQTNTALCDWVENIVRDTGKAARCYAAWDEEDKCWVEGCGINDKTASKFSIDFARKIIKEQNSFYSPATGFTVLDLIYDRINWEKKK